MDKSFLFRFGFAGMLFPWALHAIAGDIAPSPLVTYASGGHDILIVLSNTSTMGSGTLSDGITYLSASNSAISQLLTRNASDPSNPNDPMLAKIVASGQVMGLGLMTYGGTRSDSPYLFATEVLANTSTYPYGNGSPYVANSPQGGVNSPATPLIASGDEFSTGLSYNSTKTKTRTFSACNDDTAFAYSGTYSSPGSISADRRTKGFYYREVDPNAHPYCLPRSYPRYYKEEEDGACTVNPSPSTTLTTTTINSSITCNDAAPSASRKPGLGLLKLPVKALPSPTSSAAATLANSFLTSVTVNSSVGNSIEGALLTACDYYNSKFMRNGDSTPSRCYRGYPPYSTSSAAPKNIFSSIYSGDLQGITSSTPNMPSTCDASIVLLTDKLQDTTADGLSYIPDFTTLEEIPWATQPSYLSARKYTDPVSVALESLNSRNTGSKIRTFAVGLGLTSSTDITNLNKLVSSGANNPAAVAYYPTDLPSVKKTLDNIVSEIAYTPLAAGQESASSAAINSTSLQTDTLIFQGQFAYINQWYGNLIATKLDSSTLTAASTASWSAAISLNPVISPATAYPNRHIYSYNPDTNSGINFTKNALSGTQLSALSNTYDSVDNLVKWLQGDISQDLPSGKLRNRNRKLLGDIVNSDPVYTADENYAYDILPGAEGGTYSNFLRNTKTVRKDMIYVGANDGMLHGFYVGTSPSFSDGGVELFSYIPNAVIPRLTQYAAPPGGGTYYPHIYTVDGPANAGDAYLSGAWKTILLGVTGAGAKAVFALDVTNPTYFAGSNPVMWEVSDTDTQAYTPGSSADASNIHGDLGYTFGQPSIVRLNNGQWGAIVANGYSSANGKAVLFIFNLANGHLNAKLDTGVAGNLTIGGRIDKNGLSAPIAVDIDNNRTADYVYAGDLEGNLWKFDLSSSNASNWGVANSGSPIFITCASPFGSSTSCDPIAGPSYRQPITSKPNAGRATAPGQSDGVMVYFGTGKYFELEDNIVPSTAQIQTFYALWDRAVCEIGSPVAVRGDMQVQSIVAQSAPCSPSSSSCREFRTTSTTVVDYVGQTTPFEVPAKRGWYMDLLPPSAVTPTGERVIAFPVLTGGRIIFETLIPKNVCSVGGDSWIMELDALSGTRLTTPPWDLNNNNNLNDDYVNVGSGQEIPSGVKSSIGAVKTPAIIRQDNTEIKVFSGSGAGPSGVILQFIRESSSAGAVTGRISWQQVQ
jgi:Tfp pilus tip-associated adhesin PilY1